MEATWREMWLPEKRMDIWWRDRKARGCSCHVTLRGTWGSLSERGKTMRGTYQNRDMEKENRPASYHRDRPAQNTHKESGHSHVSPRQDN